MTPHLVTKKTPDPFRHDLPIRERSIGTMQPRAVAAFDRWKIGDGGLVDHDAEARFGRRPEMTIGKGDLFGEQRGEHFAGHPREFLDGKVRQSQVEV